MYTWRKIGFLEGNRIFSINLLYKIVLEIIIILGDLINIKVWLKK